MIESKLISYIKEDKIQPSDCSYDEKGVWVKNERHGIVLFEESKNPRLLFARTLNLFPMKVFMYGRDHGSEICSTIKWNEHKVKMGANVILGREGFGYERDADGSLEKMPHHGGVKIGDGVIFHNHVNVDRGVLGYTEIGEGSCIDSLVHIGHNAKIGKNVLIVAGTVIGGSVEIGDNTFIGMNVSVKNKVKIGKNVTVGAGSVVINDVQDGCTVAGVPAKYLYVVGAKGPELFIPGHEPK